MILMASSLPLVPPHEWTNPSCHIYSDLQVKKPLPDEENFLLKILNEEREREERKERERQEREEREQLQQ